MNVVDAVKDQKTFLAIADYLRSRNTSPIYSDIWVFGVNVALRISDLLDISMEDAIAATKEGAMLTVVEGKTGKRRNITLNGTAKSIVHRRACDHPGHKYLFEVESNRAKGKPISRFAVAKAFDTAGKRFKVKLGTHSMRKTLGWMMYSQGVAIERICKVLNHSHPAVTMHYIGLTDADTQAAYLEFEVKA